MEAFEIRWTPEAESTFDTIVNFIETGWNASAAEKFITKTQRLLISLASQPLAFPETAMHQVRRAVVTKQSSVFYEVKENQVVLLFFWDNRQDPLIF